MQDQRAEVDWRDGVPVARVFEDPYFSLSDGLEEARHVFLAGNDLPGRFADGFRIAELGFGTGLNLIAAVAAWGDRPGTFRFTSFEAFAMTEADRATALAAFPDIAGLAADLARAISYDVPFRFGPAEVEILGGDARQRLPQWDGMADAWFLDGFAPARNPDLWHADLMSEVARHTAAAGTFATYTAAGSVRRALDAAGFEVTRNPGFGRKRHMSRGRLR